MNGDNARMDVPSQEPSLEVVNNNSQSTRDTITDIEAHVQRIEDFLQGSRPEKATLGQAEGVPSGILAQLCTIGANNHDRLQDVLRRTIRIASSLGVPQ
jgi:hypothetical protein